MTQSIQGGLGASSYVAALQDRLGNNGASVTVSSGLIALHGAPVGRSTNLLPAIPRVVDVVSLSSTAQEFLSNSSIALVLLNNAARDAKSKFGNVVVDTSSNHPSSTGPVKQVAPIQPVIAVSGTELPSTSDGSNVSELSASQVIDIAKAQESNPSFIYDIINANKEFYTQGLSTEAKTSFLSGLSNKTLSVESTSSIAGLNYNESVTITGTNESFIGGGIYNSNILRDKAENGFITSTAFGGSFYVSWNNKPASTA